MTVHSKFSHDNSPAKKRRLKAPIPFQRPSAPELEKGQYETMKLRTTPTEANSTTYELSVVSHLFQ